uniref:Uncharacterized protein n=1 Tax=Ananas comosus var. bracteatus TaxID=296719 RepID=A0A6V7QFC5_ANACO|nr:unnamed protein product [Ananas comosus var. bracteatus]
MNGKVPEKELILKLLLVGLVIKDKDAANEAGKSWGAKSLSEPKKDDTDTNWTSSDSKWNLGQSKRSEDGGGDKWNASKSSSWDKFSSENKSADASLPTSGWNSSNSLQDKQSSGFSGKTFAAEDAGGQECEADPWASKVTSKAGNDSFDAGWNKASTKSGTNFDLLEKTKHASSDPAANDKSDAWNAKGRKSTLGSEEEDAWGKASKPQENITTETNLHKGANQSHNGITGRRQKIKVQLQQTAGVNVLHLMEAMNPPGINQEILRRVVDLVGLVVEEEEDAILEKVVIDLVTTTGTNQQIAATITDLVGTEMKTMEVAIGISEEILTAVEELAGKEEGVDMEQIEVEIRITVGGGRGNFGDRTSQNSQGSSWGKSDAVNSSDQQGNNDWSRGKPAAGESASAWGKQSSNWGKDDTEIKGNNAPSSWNNNTEEKNSWNTGRASGVESSGWEKNSTGSGRASGDQSAGWEKSSPGNVGAMSGGARGRNPKKPKAAVRIREAAGIKRPGPGGAKGGSSSKGGDRPLLLLSHSSSSSFSSSSSSSLGFPRRRSSSTAASPAGAMFNKIIKRGGRKVPKSESSSLDPSSPSPSPAPSAPLVSINHASRAAAAAGAAAPPLSTGAAAAAPSPPTPPPLPPAQQGHQGIEPLPLLRDVPAPDRPALFLRKVRICSFLFDFSDPLRSPREKEAKRQTLHELIEFVQSGSSGRLPEALQDELVRAVSANIFRPLPPSPHDLSDGGGGGGGGGALAPDPEEEEPYLDPSWPHLQLVYELLLRYVVSPTPTRRWRSASWTTRSCCGSWTSSTRRTPASAST